MCSQFALVRCWGSEAMSAKSSVRFSLSSAATTGCTNTLASGLAHPCVVGVAQFIKSRKDAALEPVLAAEVVGPSGCGAAVVGTWPLLPYCIQASLCLPAAPLDPHPHPQASDATCNSSLFALRPSERRAAVGRREQSATGCAPLWPPPAGAHPTF